MRSSRSGLFLLWACALLSVKVPAQDVELILPPLGQSANVITFLAASPRRFYLGREDAFCDFDVQAKDLRCHALNGAVPAITGGRISGRSMVFYAETAAKPSDTEVPNHCPLTVHAYDPDSQSHHVIGHLDLPCLLSKEVRLFASGVQADSYLSVVTGYAVHVFETKAGTDGPVLEPRWTHTSSAEGFSVATSDHAVYVLPEGSYFSDSRIPVTRYSFSDRRTRSLSLKIPASLRNKLGPSYLLVPSDDSTLLLVGQVGADPGEFAAFDSKSGKFRCSFTNHSLRALNPFEDILFTDRQRLLAASAEGEVLELDLCGRPRSRTGVDYLVTQIPLDLLGLQESPDHRRLFALLRGGVIGIVDREENQAIANLFLLEQDQWVALLPEGYYSASPRGHDYLSFLHEGRTLSLNQFFDAFYRPGLVDRRLAGHPVDDLMPAKIEEAIRHPPPRVTLGAMPKDSVTGPTKVSYQIESTGGGIGEIRVFHNGKLIWSDAIAAKPPALAARPQSIQENSSDAILASRRGIALTGIKESVSGGRSTPSLGMRSAPKGNFHRGDITVEPVPGANEITVSAFNAANAVQSQMQTAAFGASLPLRPPRLFILAVGIDRYRAPSATLKFAAKDALDMAAKLSARAQTLYPPERIHSSSLTDEKATRTGLFAALEDLSREIGPADQFVLFLAGHGVLLGEEYFLLTHDYDGAIREESTIGSSELVDISRRIRALSQLIILDSCHAGGMDSVVSGFYDERISILARNVGLHTYASAGSREAALDGYEGNGLFTHTLLKGLDGDSGVDRSEDGEVSIVELGRYAGNATRVLSARIGHRQQPVIIEFGRDRALYRLKHSPRP